MRPRVSVVILDLDNTLWDWVTLWYHPFRAMLTEIVRISGIPESDLYEPIAAVHRTHGTSEYAFLLEELDIVRRHDESRDAVLARFQPAIDAYREARRPLLQLYPTVFETLWKFRDMGCLVVGYTESQEFYTNYRLRRLNLDGLLDYLYSPEDHDLPPGLSKEQVRKYESDTYRLKRTVHRHTPKGELKPNPDVLRSILDDVGATPEQCIYIGDSEMKDIAMAQECGVKDVHAQYGVARYSQEYELLKEVTHWPKEAVKKEAETVVRPTYVLDHCLAQVLALFDFQPFRRQVPNGLDASSAIEVWKKTIDVQQHFNDIALRIRNVAITVLTATVGAAAITAREPLTVAIGIYAAGALALAGILAVLVVLLTEQSKSSRFLAFVIVALGATLAWITESPQVIVAPLATLVLGAGLVAWCAFFFMDKYWYHQLLKGSVKYGLRLEQDLPHFLPAPGLTGAIGAASPIKVWRQNVHSDRKMNWFYGIIGMMLVVFAAGSLVIVPVQPSMIDAATDTSSSLDRDLVRPAETTPQIDQTP